MADWMQAHKRSPDLLLRNQESGFLVGVPCISVLTQLPFGLVTSVNKNEVSLPLTVSKTLEFGCSKFSFWLDILYAFLEFPYLGLRGSLTAHKPTAEGVAFGGSLEFSVTPSLLRG